MRLIELMQEHNINIFEAIHAIELALVSDFLCQNKKTPIDVYFHLAKMENVEGIYIVDEMINCITKHKAYLEAFKDGEPLSQFQIDLYINNRPF